MERHQTLDGPTRGRRNGLRWSAPYFCEWSQVVGGRIRRLRSERGWALHELASRVRKPEGGAYTAGYFSRLERGWASAPLYVYLGIAAVLEVAPGTLLGEDEVGREVTAGERTLLRFLAAAGLPPEQAIVRLVGLPGPAPPAAVPVDAPYPPQRRIPRTRHRQIPCTRCRSAPAAATRRSRSRCCRRPRSGAPAAATARARYGRCGR